MSMLLSLWLPIVITTVVLFVASFLAWVVLPHHKPDIKRWPDEEKLLAFIRESGAPPGDYLFPYIEDKDMKEDWAQKRYNEGPWGMVKIWPGRASMPGNMIKTILYFFIVSTAVAYAGILALTPGAPFMDVFQVIAVTGILAHTSGGVLREIWFTRPLRGKIMDFLDGLAYGLITASIFAWLWV